MVFFTIFKLNKCHQSRKARQMVSALNTIRQNYFWIVAMAISRFINACTLIQKWRSFLNWQINLVFIWWLRFNENWKANGLQVSVQRTWTTSFLSITLGTSFHMSSAFIRTLRITPLIFGHWLLGIIFTFLKSNCFKIMISSSFRISRNALRSSKFCHRVYVGRVVKQTH